MTIDRYLAEAATAETDGEPGCACERATAATGDAQGRSCQQQRGSRLCSLAGSRARRSNEAWYKQASGSGTGMQPAVRANGRGNVGARGSGCASGSGSS